MTTQTATRIDTSGYAVGLVDLDDGSIAAISNAWLDHLALPAESVVGRPGVDLVRHDKEAAAQALALMRDGSIRTFVARGEFNQPLTAEAMSTIWVRPFEIGGRHLALHGGWFSPEVLRDGADRVVGPPQPPTPRSATMVVTKDDGGIVGT